ncbi:MAG TPA: cellulase family glycosylhydrolase, partial [Polyangiaceae bacterium]|nr:cellulase family glycosylhydrolase [Polyangiaceae bacterium]
GGTETGGAPTGGTATGGTNTGGTGGGGTGGGGTGGGGTGGTAGCSATGFHVSNGRLEDVTCSPFVMRGVNYPYAWFATRNTQQDFQAIASTGANAVRIVLATGGRWTRVSGSTLSSLIGWAKSSQLVAVVEVHDTTGWSEQSGSVDLTNATSYWTSQEIRSALDGQEAYVIVNVGNEPMGNNTTNDWATRHATAVTTLRNAGLRHTLMVDAPNWGQDWTNTMRDGSGTDSIWSADPDRNLVFSIHMYDVYGSSATVTSYFNGFLDRSPALPLVVGEFAADHGAAGNVDEDTIMQLSQTLGVGYLGWSWSGNSGDLASLDLTNDFAVNSLTTWGNRLVNGSNGIASTAEVCGCFD